MSLAIGTVAVGVQSILVYSFRLPNGDFDLTKGYAVAGAVMGTFLLTPGLFLYLTVSEPPQAAPFSDRASMWKGIKLTLTNVPFLMVVAVREAEVMLSY
jgi:hypothetical protein